jgi:RNA methyltransferase, TrmH family
VLAAADAAEGKAAPLLEQAARLGVRAEVTSRAAFDALADTETPSGVLAVIEWRPLALEQARRPDVGPERALVLDGVQDPGNVGTMIRTAFALGAWLTVALDGTADPGSSKVVRGAMGALFRHQVAAATFEEWRAFAARHGIVTWVAGGEGQPADALGQVTGTLALVVGNEGQGARPAWQGHPHRSVTIPMRGGADSLNAAVAAGILLFELSRAGR